MGYRTKRSTPRAAILIDILSCFGEGEGRGFMFCTLWMHKMHSWASAFRHPMSQFGTGAFRHRTRSPYSGTGLVTASAFLFIPFRYRNEQMLDCPAFPHLKKTLSKVKRDTYILHVNTSSDGLGYILHVHTDNSGKGYTIQ
jgi:hypothetical protein